MATMPHESYFDGYWGTLHHAQRNPELNSQAKPFDKKVATYVIDRIPDANALDWEDPVAGYNFYPGNFAPGTLFKYDIERFKSDDGYTSDEGGAIALPTHYGNRLFVATLNLVSDKVSFEPLVIECDHLIVGQTTECRTKQGLSTKERLNMLRIYEPSGHIYAEERARLLGTFWGKFLNQIQP